ncbi:adenylate/guanylate cyclase domain-containing protein [Pseudodonghicola xiamenensis]|uniref:Adenylate/guanylate cyclase domain-containing protein n=1 Tax=Pseudodonghicola xiamenensis TaxID=337702 RepID=A0A8J3H841_9RHOB|nr:adenylate/guanylate cyclase domain-containing protein [Pseudodonghicola xiamenensis]GHG98937.1 adenylate/guanylate cyclase domain-containing protein [Pseudodonghicola xiamenensis]
MTAQLWRGNWMTKARIVSGLVLFIFALLHFLNIGLGLFSPYWMDQAQQLRLAISRSLPGTVILYAAFSVHAALALFSLASRRTLRMPWWNWLQFVSGLAIPLLLIQHIIHTRLAHTLYGVNDQMDYLIALIWNTPDGWFQALLLLTVWFHGCVGLHFWLRSKTWWSPLAPLWSGLAVLIPAFALAGFMIEGRRISAVFADPSARQVEMARFHWPNPQSLQRLSEITQRGELIFLALLLLTLAIHLLRRLNRRRSSVRVRYVNGPEIVSPRGLTLLEMSQLHGVPHISLCGGRGRCTTCRVVVEEGGETLPPPSPSETSSLRAVNAGPNTRLACQIRPTDPLTVFRVFRPDGRRDRAHASRGQERRLAIMFLDMRGFTARTTGQLPYDVVFLLNRFFDAIVPPIQDAGGSVDKYLGDGLMAVFEAEDAQTSAREALTAASGLSDALAAFNATLATEGIPPVRIGAGLHLGDLVLGEIGAAGNAPRTIIGDAVNTASRLEGRTKDLGVELLISAPLLEAAGIDIAPLPLMELRLRGRPLPLKALPLADGAALKRLIQDTDG